MQLMVLEDGKSTKERLHLVTASYHDHGVVIM
jgi:hypothetical protein